MASILILGCGMPWIIKLTAVLVFVVLRPLKEKYLESHVSHLYLRSAIPSLRYRTSGSWRAFLLVLQVVHLIAAVWFNSYKRRLNVVTAGQLSSVESSVSYWRPEAVNMPPAIKNLRTCQEKPRKEWQQQVLQERFVKITSGQNQKIRKKMSGRYQRWLRILSSLSSWFS